MKLLLATTAAIVLLASTAHAGDIYVLPDTSSAEHGSYRLKNVPVQQNPYDSGRMNELPIRGKGQIQVNHNVPIPGDPEADLHKAKWLLQDAGYQCSIPNQRMSRR